MSLLATYWEKRRFEVTPEPFGKVLAARDDTIFVVQKHAASKLHYDLRLEINGVLFSWAVPKGPSLDTKQRRYAHQTEHHPIAYAEFEGIIPAGHYGGGRMIIWDQGSFVAMAEDPAAALDAGELKFRLAGTRLKGGFALIRLKDDANNWLLIKERDQYVHSSEDFDIIEEYKTSLISGLTLEELEAPMHEKPDPSSVPNASPSELPKAFKPQLATKNPVPSSANWVHEIKYDGYRALVFIDHGEVRMMTRNGLDWTERYGHLAEIFTSLDCETAILDGEVIVQNERGVSTLSELETALSSRRTHELTFYAFDLVHLDGYDLTRAKLLDRKALLRAFIAPQISVNSPLQFSEHTDVDGPAFFSRACDMGLEGIISKRVDSRYIEGRSEYWIKAKRVDSAELPIVGFTINAPKTVNALILAEANDKGALSYICRVGSGIGEMRGRDLHDMLSPLANPELELHDVPSTSEKPKLKGAVYIDPHFTARINYRGVSEKGTPRQPSLVSVSRASDAPEATKPKTQRKKLISDRELAAIQLTNPDREIIEGSGNSKLDIALYYAQVGDWMLPDLLNRPVTLIRCQSGKKKDCFYQRHAFNGLPEGVATIPFSEDEEKRDFIAIKEPKGFLSLPQFGTLEFHPLSCHIDDTNQPDRFIIDLDPDPDLAWKRICDAAEEIKDALEGFGFTPYVRTTGGAGLHIVMNVAGLDWKSLRSLSDAFAGHMVRQNPNLFVTRSGQANRRGKIYLDGLRNSRGASSVGSYSLRANQDLTVATPIFWTELRDLDGASDFTHKQVVARLNTLTEDPWEGLLSNATEVTVDMLSAVGVKL